MRQALAPVGERHPILIYTVARLGLFLGVAAPLYLVGLRGVTLLVIALLISGGLALFLLNGVRSQYSGRVTGYFQRLNERIDQAARAEDEDEVPTGSVRDAGPSGADASVAPAEAVLASPAAPVDLAEPAAPGPGASGPAVSDSEDSAPQPNAPTSAASANSAVLTDQAESR